MNKPGPKVPFDQRALHGVGKKRGEVVYGGRMIDLKLGTKETVGLCEDRSDALIDRLWQCPEVGLPGFVDLLQAPQLAFDEGCALAEFKFVFLSRHGHVPP
jgi:hypothetical protein